VDKIHRVKERMKGFSGVIGGNMNPDIISTTAGNGSNTSSYESMRENISNNLRR
jgi:hypothetical protein